MKEIKVHWKGYPSKFDSWILESDAMHFYASVYMCLVVTCWERAGLLAFVCGVQL